MNNLTKLLMMVQLWVVSPTGTILEIGNSDPNSCETLADALDVQRAYSGSSYNPNLIVGGNTKSQTLIDGSTSACRAKPAAFFTRYDSNSDGSLFTKTYGQFFSDTVELNNVPHYFAKTTCVKSDYDGGSGSISMYTICLEILDYNTNESKGSLVIINHASSNERFKSFYLSKDKG